MSQWERGMAIAKSHNQRNVALLAHPLPLPPLPCQGEGGLNIGRTTVRPYGSPSPPGDAG
jgi:hypothetical protein